MFLVFAAAVFFTAPPGVDTIRLPSALPGNEVAIRKVANSNPLFVVPVGGDTIEGLTSQYVMTGTDDKLHLICQIRGAWWSVTPILAGGGGAPADATYITQTPNATLTNEQALSTVISGLMFNNLGVVQVYGGAVCSGSFIRELDLGGTPLCDGVDLTADIQGILLPVNGGTGIDSSGSTGVPRVTAGAWFFDASIQNLGASSSASLRTVLTDEVGTGAAMFGLISTMSNDLGCTASQVVRRNAANTAFECVSASLDLDSIGSTRGSILERGATAWQTILPGVAGASLVSQGSGNDPIWYLAPKPLPARQGLPKPYCNPVLRANWRGTNCR